MATNQRHQETPECRTFREHYDSLCRLIEEPLSLATRMYSRDIITSAVKEEMSVLGRSRLEKNNVLLNAVEMQLQSKPSVLHVFLSALKEDPSMQSLAESMQRGLLSTTSCAHGGAESRYGEEQRIQEENSMSLVSGLDSLSVDGESVALPRHIEGTYEHSQSQHQPQDLSYQRYHHSSLEPYYHSPFHPPPHQVGHQPPHPHYPLLQPTLEQPSYQHTEHIQPPYYHPSHRPPNPQHSHLLTCTTPHQQSYYQTHHQMPLESAYAHHPPYQHPSPYHPLPSLGKPTFQHPGYSQPSTFQPSQFPPSFQVANPHPYQTAFHQDPLVQHIHAFQPPHQPTRHSPFQLPPHSGSPLEEYAIFLRGYYTQHHAPCTKWPPLNTRMYINLAVINNDYANREDLVKFRQQTIHGSINDILEWKAPIRMTDILKPNCVYSIHYPVTQLLIEGAPGSGKSTFAWEVCQKWGHHQLFNEYTLVVLLKFRDKRVQEAKSVSDLFYHPKPKLQSEIVDDIMETGGHGLLLILEGFDEAPASKRTMDSIFVSLFRGEQLPKATVILTTRPSASGRLRQLCQDKHSRRIEIVGFGKKEIDEYIQCAFSDEQSQSDFKEYLSLYPHIHSMMYVPLNSAIVTHVYESCKSSGVVVPKTMTQLYSSLIRTLLLRYLKDKDECKDAFIYINSFKDLPQPVCDQFCEICKIAYTGIMSAELIFQDLPSDFDPLGLMQTCPELYVDRGAFVSYNFLHLTIQEYLAAYHISQQSRDEQVAFMRQHIKSRKLEVVVRFLAGLSELRSDLWDVVRGFASMPRPRGSLLVKETNFIKLEILHCLFESQDPSAIASVLRYGHVCFYHDSSELQPFDVYVLGYCIPHSSCDWKLDLRNCKVELVEIFLRALYLQQDQCQLPSTGKIKGMYLENSDPAAAHLLVDNMPQILAFNNLKHLSLVTSNLTSETCNILSKHTNLLHYLEYLNLGGNLIGEGAVNLITSLTKFSTIRELHLSDTGIGFENCTALNMLLASSKYIQVLNIAGNSLSSLSVQLIIGGLSRNTSLEKLNMDYSDFSSNNILRLSSVVKTKLKALDIDCCNIQSSGCVHLAKALEENSTTQLQVLKLSDNPIGSEGAVAFASMLKKNRCLKTLDLCDGSVGVEGALELIESLKHNTTLEELALAEKCKPPSFSTLDKVLQERVKFD